MSYTAIQNTPIMVNLLVAANDTGWSQDGAIATHVTCNAGLITLTNYPVSAGQTYKISYTVLSVSSGYVQARTPGANGAAQTSANIYVETLTPASDGFVQFYSNANCQIQGFNVMNITNQIGVTIVYSATTNKWSDFRTYYPDFAVSLFTDFFSFKDGAMWNHKNGTTDRCNFYGVQFGSSIKFSTNQQPTISKTFLSVNYQCNQLLIAPDAGIATSTGQRSELIAEDFIQAEYTGGVTVYEAEGLYKASFLRDMNVDIINGSQLKGNYLTIELQATSPSTPLNLFSTEVCYVHSFANIR